MTAHVVVDLAFGDSGKGTTVDWICRQRRLTEAVVRFNGGPQAGHNVVLPDGRHHQFSQFGAGTFAGVATFLSRFMAIDPLRLAAESDALARIGVPDPYSLITADAESLVVTPYHGVAQQREELERGDNRHGSCGTGFGEAVQYQIMNDDIALRMKDLGTPSGMKKLSLLLDHYHDRFGAHFLHDFSTGPVDAIWDAYEAASERLAIVDGHKHMQSLFESGGDVIFEGAQGVLLDQDFGFHPHTTWSNTTFLNADVLLADVNQLAQSNHIGVTRSYMTRHGPGPFVTESEMQIEEPHNPFNDWQREFRVGHFDFTAMLYAKRVCGGVDNLVITHLDKSQNIGFYSYGYRDEKRNLIDYIPTNPAYDLAGREQITEWMYTLTPELSGWGEHQALDIADGLSIPPLMCSWGPTWRDKTTDIKQRSELDTAVTPW